MPRPPRFTVLLRHEKDENAADNAELSADAAGTGGIVPRSGLAFPVICKPVEACGECRMNEPQRHDSLVGEQFITSLKLIF